MSSRLAKNTIEAVQNQISLLGFISQSKGLMFLPHDDGVIGWCGLNTAMMRDAIEVNPVVGVRNQAIERTLAELLEERFDPVIPPTVAGNIGYMTPNAQYRGFVFREDTDFDNEARQISQLVGEFGLPFINANIDISSIIETMRTARFAIPHQVKYRIAVGLMLLARYREMEQCLDQELIAIGERQDPAASDFRRFADRLRSRARY